MKASLKLREGQKPLVRAKIPLNVLGFPLVSGISVGDSKELCLHLGTFWDTGPALKVAYKPNDSWNPFSLIVKTGIGLWGSPEGAAMAMSAEINLLGRGNPSFCLQLKPQLGDFTVKQSARSSLVLPSKQGEDVGLFGCKSNHPSLPTEGLKSGSTDFSFSKEAIPSNFPLKINGLENEGLSGKGKVEDGPSFEKTADLENGVGAPNTLENGGFAVNLPEKSTEEKHPTYQFSERLGNLKEFQSLGVEKLLAGVSLTAHSSLPVRKHAVVQIRWGLKLPSDLFKGWESGYQSGFSVSKLPYLVLDKIGIENVEKMRRAKNSSHYDRLQAPLENIMMPIIKEEANELAQVTGMCYSMRRQLHLLQTENRVLKKAMEDMRSELQYKGIRNSTHNFSNAEANSWQKSFQESRKNEKPRESNYKEGEKKKGGSREVPKKEHRSESKVPNAGLRNDFSINTEPPSIDVSEELEKAIRSASGSLGDKPLAG
eukprot:Gb_28633 [translate_table: standard]